MFRPTINKEEIINLYKKIIKEAEEGKIPAFDFLSKEQLKSFFDRNVYTKISWSIVTAESAKKLSVIASGMQIHGIYSGTGLWEKLISCFHEKHVSASDLNPPEYTFMEVNKSKASDSIDLIDDAQNTCLFMSWPTYKCEDVTKAVTKFRNKGGRKIIFIGESYGDCTGCDSLWEDEFFVHWTNTEEITIPIWQGLHDCIKIYELN